MNSSIFWDVVGRKSPKFSEAYMASIFKSLKTSQTRDQHEAGSKESSAFFVDHAGLLLSLFFELEVTCSYETSVDF
jgi:hypothetical protein